MLSWKESGCGRYTHVWIPSRPLGGILAFSSWNLALEFPLVLGDQICSSSPPSTLPGPVSFLKRPVFHPRLPHRPLDQPSTPKGIPPRCGTHLCSNGPHSCTTALRECVGPRHSSVNVGIPTNSSQLSCWQGVMELGSDGQP